MKIRMKFKLHPPHDSFFLVYEVINGHGYIWGKAITPGSMIYWPRGFLGIGSRESR